MIPSNASHTKTKEPMKESVDRKISCLKKSESDLKSTVELFSSAMNNIIIARTILDIRRGQTSLE